MEHGAETGPAANRHPRRHRVLRDRDGGGGGRHDPQSPQPPPRGHSAVGAGHCLQAQGDTHNSAKMSSSG